METYDEFDDPSRLQQKYCLMMTEEEYEMQASEETYKALKELMEFIEKNPAKYSTILKKKKKDEYENSSSMSFFKSKFMSAIGMSNYLPCSVSEPECEEKLQDLKSNMYKAFNYSQDAKKTRFSKRLAYKNNKENQSPLTRQALNPTNIPPPPPLPPPLPTMLSAVPSYLRCKELSGPKSQPCSPLKERNSIEIQTPNSVNILEAKSKLKRDRLCHKENGGSCLSIAEELALSNPLRRLKSTNQLRSPGGTPVQDGGTPLQDGHTPNHNSFNDPLMQAFSNILKEKFRNVRSPSPMSTMQSSVWEPASPGIDTP